MKCHDLIPTVTTVAGVGASVTIPTAGYDWVSILLFINLVGGVAAIQVMTDSGTNFGVDAITLAAGAQGEYSFGGLGACTKSTATVSRGASPYVPNKIVLFLPAVLTASWSYAVIGGKNE